MTEKHRPSAVYLDDEEINLVMFNEMFKKDFEIYTTTSPYEAISYIKDHNVDLIITDQMMPDMTGVEFLRELNESYPKLPAKRIMISGYTKDKEITEALNTNILDEFVSKPWVYDDLKGVLLSPKG